MRPVALAAAVLPVVLACGAAPQPTETPQRSPVPAARPGVRQACEEDPTPLERTYHGVASKARCDREIYTIMGGVRFALGVECTYCHIPDDFVAMTDRKLIANWMASELVPALRAKTGKDVWCPDCHQSKAKILGYPRDRSIAIEWMTTHLVESFETAEGDPLLCRTCHAANLGSEDFRTKIILTDHLPGRGEAAPAAPAGVGTEALPTAPAEPATPAP